MQYLANTFQWQCNTSLRWVRCSPPDNPLNSVDFVCCHRKESTNKYCALLLCAGARVFFSVCTALSAEYPSSMEYPFDFVFYSSFQTWMQSNQMLLCRFNSMISISTSMHTKERIRRTRTNWNKLSLSIMKSFPVFPEKKKVIVVRKNIL